VFTRGFKSWCENTALQMRRVLNVRAFDPLNPWTLAEHLQIRVWNADQIPGLDAEYLQILLREDSDSWSAVTLCVDSKALVILNPSHSGGRPASDLTHELSHILIGHKAARIDVSEDGLILSTYDRKQEEEAAWLSGCLLLPREALLFIRQQQMDQQTVIRTYGVSLDMFQYRLNVTGVDRQLSQTKRGRK
jgi:Zn-dependent peptidase ImmA (M78 family)